jgi:nifR3 family TIM-barrel protein
MAGVTNAPFRTLCRRYGAGLYVSEMVMARAVIGGGARTMRMISFAPGETPRSIQLYGTEPVSLAAAVRFLIAEVGVDHIDMNFGCPAPKVTRNGGGSAVPLKRNLLRAIVRAAVQAAEAESAGRVPVTIKFRKGLNDDLLTYLDAGRIGEEEGVAAVALHARTAQQLYSGSADWEAITRLKEHVSSIPVFGNGDIWEADDAVKMMEQTGCDGVVVGRGCLGRPWLFRDLTAVFSGRPVPAPPLLGEVLATMREHAQMLFEYYEGVRGIRDFRKHASWYVTGYAVGPEMRRRLGMVDSLEELDRLIGEMDHTLELPPGGQRIARGHTNGPRPVSLPHGYLDNLDDDTPPSADAESMASGG